MVGSWTFGAKVEKGIQNPNNERLLPGKLTCPLKINGWKMDFLLK